MDIREQLERAGYLSYVASYTPEGRGWRGRIDLEVISLLDRDDRFAKGLLYGLHLDVGDGRNLVDYRSYTGALGRGSLQIVIDRDTGDCWIDVDRHCPYEDVVRFIGHAGEVIAGFFAWLFRRRPNRAAPDVEET